MKIIEIVILVIMLLGVLIGLKKGAVKEIFELIGTLAILIISYLLKSYLTALLIKTMPFFNFKGYVGKGHFDVIINGSEISIPFEVRSKKIDYLKDYPPWPRHRM